MLRSLKYMLRSQLWFSYKNVVKILCHFMARFLLLNLAKILQLILTESGSMNKILLIFSHLIPDLSSLSKILYPCIHYIVHQPAWSQSTMMSYIASYGGVAPYRTVTMSLHYIILHTSLQLELLLLLRFSSSLSSC